MTDAMEQVRKIIRTKTRVHHRVDGSAITEDDIAHEIFSIPEILIKDSDQTLPTVKWTASPDSTPSVEFVVSQAYKEAYKDWKKVLPKEEK